MSDPNGNDMRGRAAVALGETTREQLRAVLTYGTPVPPEEAIRRSQSQPGASARAGRLTERRQAWRLASVAVLVFAVAFAGTLAGLRLSSSPARAPRGQIAQSSGVDRRLWALDFLGPQVGFAIERQAGGPSRRARCSLVRTIDGGRSWERVANLPQVEGGAALGSARLQFFNRTEGVLLVHGELLGTWNGGAGWAAVLPNLGTAGGAGVLSMAEYAGRLWVVQRPWSHVAAATRALVVVTGAAGLSAPPWRQVAELPVETGVRLGAVVPSSGDVAFLPFVRRCDKPTCTQQTYPGVLRIAVGARAAQRSETLPCPGSMRDQVGFAAEGTALLVVCSEMQAPSVGPTGATEVYTSWDGGRLWNLVSRSTPPAYPRSNRMNGGLPAAPMQVVDVQIASAYISYVICRTGPVEQLYVSRDAGGNWHRVGPLPPSSRSISLSVASPSVAYVSVPGSGLWHSTDAGRRWQQMT